MADDVNAAWRAEIEAALAVIGPEIEGLIDLQGIHASAEFLAFIAAQLSKFEGRENLMRAVIAALDAANVARALLEASGYPSVDKIPMEHALFEEKKKQQAEIEAAFALFEDEPVAASMTVALGAPSKKP